MIHRPICSRCQGEMRPLRNGVVVVDHASFGPYETWNADEWACPTCGYAIIVGFGVGPERRHFEESFTSHVESIPSDLRRDNFG